MQDVQPSLELSGLAASAPVLPLPDVVLFPCALLPIHIFEHRYRAMVRDALAGEGCLVLTRLRTDPGGHPLARPDLHEVGCAGRIVKHEQLPDGRFHIVLCGHQRVRIQRFVTSAPYRRASVQLLADAPLDQREEEEAERLRKRLLRCAGAVPPGLLRHRGFAAALRKLDPPLGALSDLLADSLLIPSAAKQALLEELDPIRRAGRLLHAVQSELLVGPSYRRFLPYPCEPSTN